MEDEVPGLFHLTFLHKIKCPARYLALPHVRLIDNVQLEIQRIIIFRQLADQVSLLRNIDASLKSLLS